ncbi:alpha/beta hydrolase [Ekhidna sp.]|uniref:alpha/beta hydrolase n=1 Tax=Ekhidna sp. TaxID=2608089 RepID=UPI003C7E19EC
MSKQHHIPVSIKASYYTLNKLTEKTKRIWVVFHGYGQLAEYFIKKFEGLDPEKNFIIAPQGLSKYYLDGVYGRVGASWMTKEDRLTEIENQYAYIDAVLGQFDLSDNELIYFGFSQGTATMGRYAAYAKTPFHKMIIWAGTFPPDTDPKDWKYLTGEEEISYYTSKEDKYFKEEMVENQNSVLKAAMNREPELHWYEGGHRVIPEIVATL